MPDTKFYFEKLTGDDLRNIVAPNADPSMENLVDLYARLLNKPRREVTLQEMGKASQDLIPCLWGFFADLLDALEKERFEDVIGDADFFRKLSE